MGINSRRAEENLLCRCSGPPETEKKNNETWKWREYYSQHGRSVEDENTQRAVEFRCSQKVARKDWNIDSGDEKPNRGDRVRELVENEAARDGKAQIKRPQATDGHGRNARLDVPRQWGRHAELDNSPDDDSGLIAVRDKKAFQEQWQNNACQTGS